jgi:hypothetical protein
MWTSTLVICELDVQSSYLQNEELPATERAFDTVQYYQAQSGAWRIKTYAVDEDVHVWSIGKADLDVVELAQSNTQKMYGDVLRVCRVFQTSGGVDGLRIALVRHGLSPHLEMGDSGFVFWAPDGTRYRTPSSPH